MAYVSGKKLAGNSCLSGWMKGLNRLMSSTSFSTRLFVSRLSYYTTDEELRQVFSPFGKVTEARLVRDQRTGRPKGYGFVTYESEAEAQKAIKAMDCRIHEGRLIFVEFAKPRPEETNSAS